MEELRIICNSSIKRSGSILFQQPNYFEMERSGPIGHFWITFDHFQSSSDQHGVGSRQVGWAEKEQVVWLGNQVEKRLLKNVVELRTIFRMTANTAKTIEKQCLVPEWKSGESDVDLKIRQPG